MKPKDVCAVDVHVGKQMRVRRMLSGMSQEEVGEKLGLTFQQVQKYEKGINRIGAGRLYKISQILGVPISHFFDGLQDETTESTIVDVPDFTQADLLKIAKAFSAVPLRQRKPLVQLIQSFVTTEEPVQSA